MKLPWSLKTQLPLALLTAVALALAYEPFQGLRDLAWVAFIPLLLVCRHVSPRRAMFLGWFTGTVFCTANLYWLLAIHQQTGYAAAIGCTLTMAALNGLMWIPFTGFTSAWFRRHGAANKTQNLLYLLFAACIWVAFEFIRSNLPGYLNWTWNTLAISQAQNLAVIQLADIGGVYLVGFLVIFINLAFATTILRYLDPNKRRRLDWHPEIMIAMLLFAVTIAYGIVQIRSHRANEPNGTPFHVASVQTNVPQYEKWDQAFATKIIDELYTLTVEAAATEPDLIIWPETALPDDLGRYTFFIEAIIEQVNTPILTGTMLGTDYVNGTIHNSAVLVGTNLTRLGVYHKQHTVAFGEFVPFGDILPFMKHIVPIEFEVNAGTNTTVFSLDTAAGKPVSFSSLICFEDTMPYLGRQANRAGSRLLINQTNDGWFDPFKASWQQADHCVFRCVEQRLPAVRCANTGLTCSIKPWGETHDKLGPNAQGHTRYKDIQTSTVIVPPADHPLTVYARFGDLIALIVLLIGFIGLASLVRKPAPKQTQ